MPAIVQVTERVHCRLTEMVRTSSEPMMTIIAIFDQVHPCSPLLSRYAHKVKNIPQQSTCMATSHLGIGLESESLIPPS